MWSRLEANSTLRRQNTTSTVEERPDVLVKRGKVQEYSGSELDQAPVVQVLPHGVVQAQEPILQGSRAQLLDVPGPLQVIEVPMI